MARLSLTSGLFFRAERSEVWLSRLVGGQEVAGSNPAVLTEIPCSNLGGNHCGVWESLEIRVPWEHETAGSTPATPTRLWANSPFNSGEDRRWRMEDWLFPSSILSQSRNDVAK